MKISNFLKPRLQFIRQSLAGIAWSAAFIFTLPLAFAAEDPAATQQQLETVSAAIGEIESWLDTAAERYTDEQETLRATELSLAAVNQSISELLVDISSYQNDLTSLQTRQQELDNSIAQQSETLGEIIRAAYISGEDGFLKTLLNQQDPSEADRMLHYARVLGDYQQSQIQTYQESLDELDGVNTELTQTLQTLTTQQLVLQTEQQQLEALKTERASALAALNSDIAARSSELEQLEVNRAELEDLLEQIARAMEGIRSFEDVPALPEQRGQLARPLNGPILSRYGASYGGGSLTRQGILIGAPEGSAVHAVHPGYVAFANWLRGSGLLIVLDHGDGYVSLYGGNQALGVQAGDWVAGGDVIATSGRGIETQETGLYFELRYQGAAQDPGNWLAPQN